MDVALLTVGDEVLAGDTANTNATWLASQITERGSSVARILTLPDDQRLITETVREWSVAFDAVVVTGGLGGTHDDVTAAAIAAAFDRPLTVDDAVREDVVATVAAYRGLEPDAVTADDLELDVDAWAALPAGCRPLVNPAGLCPGCVLENVYAFPGVPSEMKALFESVAEEFGGNGVSRTIYTSQSEASMIGAIAGVRERFDVTVGSYPDTEADNRLKVTGTDQAVVDAAVRWLGDRIDVVADE